MGAGVCSTQLTLTLALTLALALALALALTLTLAPTLSPSLVPTPNPSPNLLTLTQFAPDERRFRCSRNWTTDPAYRDPAVR